MLQSKKLEAQLKTKARGMSISASRSLSIEETSCLIQEIAKSVGVTLKEKQSSALTSFCEGNDVFITLPTGYGKSMIFDLLPLVFDKRKGMQMV